METLSHHPNIAYVKDASGHPGCILTLLNRMGERIRLFGRIGRKRLHSVLPSGDFSRRFAVGRSTLSGYTPVTCGQSIGAWGGG